MPSDPEPQECTEDTVRAVAAALAAADFRSSEPDDDRYARLASAALRAFYSQPPGWLVTLTAAAADLTRYSPRPRPDPARDRGNLRAIVVALTRVPAALRTATLRAGPPSAARQPPTKPASLDELPPPADRRSVPYLPERERLQA